MMQMETTTAIFESTAHAVHVAFEVLGAGVKQDSMLRKALINMLEALNLQAHRGWLEQLRGQPSENVHFEGLSTSDIRAQCALIMVAVRTRLPKTEMWALQAKYGTTEYEGPVSGRRYAFSAEKAAAIKELSAWLSPSFGGVSRQAMDCMVARFYTRHAKIEISYRELAHEFGGSRMTYARAFPKIRSMLKPLEEMALQRLTPHFVEQGIVADHSTC